MSNHPYPKWQEAFKNPPYTLRELSERIGVDVRAFEEIIQEYSPPDENNDQ